MGKKLLSLILVIVLAFTVAMPTVFADNNATQISSDETGKNAHGITIIGDSMAAGYSLEQESKWSDELKEEDGGYVYEKRPLGSAVRVPNSYASLVADGLGLKWGDDTYKGYFFNQTRAGFRTVEVLRMLDPEFDAQMEDNYMSTELILNGHSDMTAEEIEYMKENSADQIKKSKLVMVEIGENDITLTMTLAASNFTHAFAEAEGKLIDTSSIQTAMENAMTGDFTLNDVMQVGLEEAERIGALPEAIKGFTQAMLSSATSLFTYYKKVIDKIYELNPYATVVTIGLLNPWKDIHLSLLPDVNVGRVVDIGTSLVNSWMSNLYSGSEYDYRYCDVTDYPVRANGNNTLLEAVSSMIGMGGTMENADALHPGVDGHAYMAEKILETLGDDFSLGLENASGTIGNSTGLPFDDVSANDWFCTAVKYVYSKGYMAGVSSTKFEPNTKLSRAMVVTILYAIDGKKAVASASEFTDVKDTDWYKDPVNWASANGITAGYEDGTFRPSNDVTREQLATMLRSYAIYKNANSDASGDLSGFTDNDNISSWATDNVKWAVGNGIISGKGNGIIDPQGTATRAEMAQMIYKFTLNLL